MPQTPTSSELAVSVPPQQQGPLLSVRGLKTQFRLDEGLLRAVDGVSLEVQRGQTIGVIGESGCGKSMLARSLMGLVRPPGRVAGGELLLDTGEGPVDIAKLDPTGAQMRRIRGRHIAMIFQEPMTSLSPVHTIGAQIAELALLHRTHDRAEARTVTEDALARVGMPDPRRAYGQYPHELSGGLRQRAMIAMALTGQPELLIADEPTTALDVTVQWQILRLLADLKSQLGMSMLYITHDLGVTAQIADTIAVMYLGRIVEFGRAVDIFERPLHPYTRKLMQAAPAMGKRQARLDVIRGTVPVPINLPRECPFRSRCDHAFEACAQLPALKEVEPGHTVRCFLHHQEVERDD
ncbi:ABC transporter ATP-binding protein [Deinococcus sp.]|uniref:ABC transporter ATP-binding protein n=1 Tax=Deinococcus sp. TaxID=47478 RepID=UPI003CC5F3CD